jgi:hypothetical protein
MALRVNYTQHTAYYGCCPHVIAFQADPRVSLEHFRIHGHCVTTYSPAGALSFKLPGQLDCRRWLPSCQRQWQWKKPRRSSPSSGVLVPPQSARCYITMCLTAVQVCSLLGQWAATRSPLGGGKAGGTVAVAYPRPCLRSGQVRSGQGPLSQPGLVVRSGY